MGFRVAQIAVRGIDADALYDDTASDALVSAKK